MPTTLPPNQPNAPVSSAPAQPVINGHQTANGSLPPPTPRRSGWKIFGWTLFMLLLGAAGLSVGVLLNILKPQGKEAGNHHQTIGQGIGNIIQLVTDPRSGFPGKDKIVICCMGIDDNWTNSDQVYTAAARTDTLFLLTLDLVNKKVTMLSIPRDTYVAIAGANYSGKINAAYSTGGPSRTEATVQQWLNVTPDYYMVLNIDATKRLVDALGGVDVDVEHQMDYDDEWGHLHVHLKPGEQHLDGNQAVGFARFRHAKHGVTPEDGDERRMYRQHVLLQAMIVKSKTFTSLLDANSLIDTGMQSVRTNLTRAQLADLAAIFDGIDPAADVTTASLSGEDARGPHGEYVMTVDQKTAQLFAQWLVDGDEDAGRQLTPVKVANGTTISGIASSAVTQLRGLGYSDSALGAASSSRGSHEATTRILDTGVADKSAAADIANLLAVPDAAIVRKPVTANKFGWTPPADVEVTLGADYAHVQPK